MLKSISKFATSVMGLTSSKPSVSDIARNTRCEEIREAVLYLLEKCQQDDATQRVHLQIFNARDIESLWYLRAPVYAKLVQVMGSSWACEQMDSVTSMFRGYLSPAHFKTNRDTLRTR